LTYPLPALSFEKNTFMRTVILTVALIAFIIAPSFSQNLSTMKTVSTEIIRYKISDGERENFINAYTAATKYLQASEYCLGYELIQGDEEPGNFIVVIHWTSKNDHLNGFRKSTEFGPFFNLVRPFYNNIEEMKHYDSKFKWEKSQ
jgi:quinol monooxygenase YgiN